MSAALDGSSAIRHFEQSDAIKIHDGRIFDFYMGLPCDVQLSLHVYTGLHVHIQQEVSGVV